MKNLFFYFSLSVSPLPPFAKIHYHPRKGVIQFFDELTNRKYLGLKSLVSFAQPNNNVVLCAWTLFL